MVGKLVDLIVFDVIVIDFEGWLGDDIFDSFIFVGDDCLVSDVWLVGWYVVIGGNYIKGEII